MSPAEQIDQAKQLLERGLHQAAVDLLAEVLREYPRHVDTHKALAQVRFAQGHRSWGYSLLRRAALLERDANESVAEALSVTAPAAEEDPDVSYAAEIESAVLSEVEEFSDSEHDPYTNDERPDVEVRDASQSEQSPLGRQPTLRLGTDNGSRRSRIGSGPTIVWKRRPRHGLEVQVALSDNEVGPAAGTATDEPTTTDETPVSVYAPVRAVVQSPQHLPQTSVGHSGQPAQVSLFDAEAYDDGWNDDPGLDNWDDRPEVETDTTIGFWDELSADAPVRPTQQDGGDFDWSEVDISFDDEDEESEVEALTAAEADTPAIPTRIELWRRIEQIALDTLIEAGRLENPSRARFELRVLTRVLLEGSVSVRRPDISAQVRARHIGDLLRADVAIEEIAAAHACRQAWAENPEFHVDMGGRTRGEGWMRKEDVRHLFAWNSALSMARIYQATDIEEFRYVFFSLYERWSGSRQLKRSFPIFARYVSYRLIRTGCDLDEHPHWVFDDPDEPAYVEQWEDDPVRRPTFRQGLQSYGLIPEPERVTLDLPPVRKPKEEAKEQRHEQAESD